MADDQKNSNLENNDSQKDEEQKNTDTEEILDDVDELDDLDDLDDQDDTDEPEESPKEDKDSVPLATFLEQKKKLKTIEKKLAEMEDAKFEDSIQTKKAKIKQKWLDKNFDEATAEAIAEEMANVYTEFGKAKTSKQEAIMDMEIEELSEDDFYSDIKSYKEQIKSKIKSFKKAGVSLTPQDAYLLVVGVTTKLKETKIDSEVKASVKKGASTSSKSANVATSTGSGKSRYSLSTEDMKNLKRLQKLQPDSKWDAKKYYNYVLKK